MYVYSQSVYLCCYFLQIVFRRKRKRGRLIVDGKHYFQNYRIACDTEGFASMTLGGIHPSDADFVDSFEV